MNQTDTSPAAVGPSVPPHLVELAGQLVRTEKALLALANGSMDAGSLRKHQAALQQAVQALQSLHHSSHRENELQRAVFDALPFQVALIGRDGKIHEVNDAWRAFSRETGLAWPTGGTGANFFDLCAGVSDPGGEYARATAECTRRVLDGELPEFALEYPRPLGTGEPSESRLWYRLQVTPVCRPEFNGALIAHANITQRKVAENALREERNLLRTLIDHLPDYIYVKDSQTRFLLMNASSLRLLGIPKVESVVGKSVTDYFPPDMAHAYTEDDQQVLRTGEALLNREEPIVNTDDEIRWLLTTKVPLRDETGAIIGLVGISRDITERKRAVEELRIAHERFQVITCATNDVFWDCNLESESAWWGEALLNVFGYEKSELQDRGETWAGLIHANDRERVVAGLKAMIRSGQKNWQAHYRFQRKNGSFAEVFDRGFVIHNREGRAVRMVGAMIDMTERRRSEARLQESEERFQLAVQAVNAGIWDWNLATNEMYVSLRFVELLGYAKGEALNTPESFFEAIHPEEREKTQAACRAHLLDHNPFNMEVRIRTKTGEYRWFDLRGQALWDETGAPYRMVGALADVTERKRADDLLLEQAALLDKAQDAILVKDLEGRVLFWNKSAQRVHGWTAEEVKGKRADEFLHYNPAEFQRALKTVLEKGDWSGEFKKKTKDGREVITESRWTLVQDAEGRPRSILAINTDVTEKKRLEAQFLRAQRLESIGTLASGIAHDLNNVLTPILMAVAMLKERVSDEDGRSMLRDMEINVRRGADIIRQVLSFGRGMQGERVAVQPRHLVREVERMIRETFPRGIRLEFEEEPGLWTVTGDPTQLHQVLLNLCVNARDAMLQGGRLGLRLYNVHLDENYAGMHPDAKSGSYVILEVSDTGTGIPAEIRDKIFEPFFTTKEVGKGTGLGLSTVLAIVKSHEGFINVSSDTGRGSVFKVYLPAAGGGYEDAPKIQPRLLPRGNGETILIVDDEEPILNIARKTLERHGYQVVTATDGASAIAIYAQNRDKVAAVITDMMMPVMDGPATIHALMKINPGVKVIAASGLENKTGGGKAANTGVKNFLSKPYTAEALMNLLHKVLNEPAE